MNKKELTKYLPDNDGGIEGIDILHGIGFPGILPIVKSLMNRLEVTGFPSTEIDLKIAKILTEGGGFLTDLMREALTANRAPQKKQALLESVLPFWSPDELKPLENELYSLVLEWGFHKTDVLAIKIMLSKGLSGHEDLESWLTHKLAVYEGKLDILNQVSSR